MPAVKRMTRKKYKGTPGDPAWNRDDMPAKLPWAQVCRTLIAMQVIAGEVKRDPPIRGAEGLANKGHPFTKAQRAEFEKRWKAAVARWFKDHPGAKGGK